MSGQPSKRKQNHVSKPRLNVSECSPSSLEPLSKKPKGKAGLNKAPLKAPPTPPPTPPKPPKPPLKPPTKPPPKLPSQVYAKPLATPPSQVCAKPLNKAIPKPPTTSLTKPLNKDAPKTKLSTKPSTKALAKTKAPKALCKASAKSTLKHQPTPITKCGKAKSVSKTTRNTKTSPKSLSKTRVASTSKAAQSSSAAKTTLVVSKEKLQKRKIKEAKKQVKSKPRKKSRVCDYNSFRKRAQACFASQEEHESLLWKSIYGDSIPKKACALRDDLYLRAAEAVLLGDLDAHNVQPLDVLVDQNIQILPPSKDQASQLVFSELRGQLLKCMDGKLDLPACPVCKTDEFMSSCLIQVRSGDEAMGVFPQCLKCKHIVRTQRR